MLTEAFPLHSLRVGCVRAYRTRPSRQRTTLLISALGILNRTSRMMLLLRGPHQGTVTVMVLQPRGITSHIFLAVPPAEALWHPRPRFLHRILAAIKQVLERESP